jgi:raffinose/stachyose/melibiose transport system permease protein
MKPQIWQTASANVVALIVSLLAIIPGYLVAVNALKSQAEASSLTIYLPTTLHWDNFLTVIERGKLVQSFFNSLLYSSASTAIAVLVSAMAAYVFSRNPTRVNRMLYFFVIMGIAMPLNFFTLTKIMQITHLINTRPGMILLYAATQIPFSVFLMYAYIDSIPRELDEAAIVDGCGPLRLFFRIILPLSTPVVVTVAVLNFLGVWNDFLLPLYYLNNSTNWPMTLAVYNFFGQFQSDWSLVSADILLTVLPVLVIYLIGQRFILSGMTAGAIKG